MLSANPDRLGATLFNDSPSRAFVAFGSTPALVPVSIASYATVSNWFSLVASTVAKTVTSVAWEKDDIIVVIAGSMNDAATGPAQLTPSLSNANLSFSLAVDLGGNTGTECGAWLYTATAGSAQTGQTISFSASWSGGTTQAIGFSVWVLRGASGVRNATGDHSEASISRTVLAGSTVIHGLMDWNSTNPPGKTPLTGSGTPNERLDQGDTTHYAQWLSEWVGVAAGTFSFGPNNYTSLKVSQVIVEVAAAGTTLLPFHQLMAPGSVLEVPFGYRGLVAAYWDAPASGSMRISEHT